MSEGEGKTCYPCDVMEVQNVDADLRRLSGTSPEWSNPRSGLSGLSAMFSGEADEVKALTPVEPELAVAEVMKLVLQCLCAVATTA